jgi:hypothetical protein
MEQRITDKIKIIFRLEISPKREIIKPERIVVTVKIGPVIAPKRLSEI